jgi:quercetin dioxygenase-like cupin family protein
LLEGELQLNVKGASPRIVKAGEAYHNKSGIVHDTKNIGDKLVRAAIVFVIDKGRPPSEPVK